MTEALYRQHAAFVAGFLARLGVSPRHVDDELMRVFAEVNRRAASAPTAASAKAWIAALAVEGASRRGMLARRPPAKSGAGRIAAELPLGQFLLTLEPQLRALFVLFELEAESSESLAAAFELPVETIHERLCEGQREYRRAYGALEAVAAPVEDDERGVPAFVDPVSLV